MLDKLFVDKYNDQCCGTEQIKSAEEDFTMVGPDSSVGRAED